MARDEAAPGRERPEVDGQGMRIAIVCARFNDRITERLLAGARRGLAAAGVVDDDIYESWVPGAFELAFAAKVHAETRAFDAVIVLGAVIRGETTHYDIVAGESARGVQNAQLATGVPILFGVLTTEDLDQALARSEDEGEHNVGEECGLGAVEMVSLCHTVRGRMV